MIYELRHYTIQPGQMAAFIDIMETIAIPFQVSQGMEVIGSFVSSEDPDCFVWLRRYRDEQHKLQLYDLVYGSETWQSEIRPRFDAMLIREKMRCELLHPTPRSLLPGD